MIHVRYTPYNLIMEITTALKYVPIIYWYQKHPYNTSLKTGSNDILVLVRAVLKERFVDFVKQKSCMFNENLFSNDYDEGIQYKHY